MPKRQKKHLERIWLPVLLLAASAAIGVSELPRIGHAQSLSAARGLPVAKAGRRWFWCKTPSAHSACRKQAGISGLADQSRHVARLDRGHRRQRHRDQSDHRAAVQRSGSISVSGAGGLPGTATPPPGLSTETLEQIPVGTPPFNSIYGSQSNLGSC